MKRADILILGAGPAGMAAAIEVARAGAAALVVDENPQPGGQIFRQADSGLEIRDARRLSRDHARGQALIREFEARADRITCLRETRMWGIFNDREAACFGGGEAFGVRFRKLIITAGAYDRPVPFPGWTLPGVLTAGGAQRLVKTQGILPGRRILLAGTGPLQLALASQICKAGGKVVALAEAGDVQNWADLIRGLWGQWSLMGDAVSYLRTVGMARIPILRRHVIVEARGDGRVEEAVVAAVDRQWRPMAGTQKRFAVDAVCSGYGFVPSSEMTLLAGCDHHYKPQLGGWIPVRGATLQTSRNDIYAAGDCTGVAGSKVALAEGRIAGAYAAAAIGCLSESEAARRTLQARRELAALSRFRAAMDEISAPRPGLFELARPETIICRCQEISLADLQASLRDYCGDINEVKRLTSAGMGPCQGRICGQIMQEIVSRRKGLSAAAVRHLAPRPPIKPIPLAALAAYGS